MSKISPELEREVLGRHVQGASADEIAKWLKTDHGISISGRALRSRLAKTRTERADVAKAVVREKLGKTVVSDLDRLEKIRKQAASKAAQLERAAREPQFGADGRRIKGELKYSTWLDLKALEVRILDRKLHFAGADTPDGGPVDLDVKELSDEQLRAIAGDASARGARAAASSSRK